MSQLVIRRSLSAVLGLCLAALATTASAQTTSTSKQSKAFEIVSIDGNKMVVKEATGAEEYTVPPDFHVTVAGKQLTLADLKPGMKGTATITTTTTTVPVHVTTVKNGEVMQASGSSIIVKGPDGIKMFNEGDLKKRNVTIIKDGKPVQLSDLHSGDHLSATIVTEGTPKVLTQKQYQATLAGGAAPAAGTASGAKAPAAKSSAAKGEAAGGTMAPAAGGKKHLPKTASNMPLVGLLGALSLAIGLSLFVARKRQTY